MKKKERTKNMQPDNTLGARKRFSVPDTYVIVSICVIIMAILTYIIPSGTYERIIDPNLGDREVVNPESFTYVENSPVSVLDILTSFTKGMQSAGDIIFFVFIIGGVMEIINATGAIERGIGSLANKRFIDKLFIPVFAFIFGIFGATFGASDELVIFAPIGVAVAHAIGYDALTGLAAVTLGAAVGFNAGFLNPFSTNIAQSIAELPPYSGITYRLVIFVLMFIVTVIYIGRYAARVKADPSLSIVKDCRCETEREDVDVSRLERMTARDGIVLLVLIGGIGLMIFGVFKLGWYLDEMAGIFVGVGIICGFIGRLGPNGIASNFVSGAAALTYGALITGFAKAIVIMMEDGQIMDTIIHSLSSIVLALPTGIAVLGMYVVQIIVSFIIPSSTGQAATIMPIMIPLADIVGITRQTSVLCFQFGDGFSNSFIPTSSVLMSYLAVSKVPYEKWIKFVCPLMIVWTLMGAVFLVIADMMNYGPM